MGLLLSMSRQRATLMGLALSTAGLGLTGCYVAPLHHAPPHAPVMMAQCRFAWNLTFSNGA
jgi:hypothetical protein